MSNNELAKIDYGNGMSTKEIADKYNVSVATVRKWKSRYNWDSVTKKRDKSVTRKKTKETAKILIQEGASISEVANQTELHPSSVKRLSVSENLQQSQLEYLKKFREEQRERIRANKLKRLSLNEEALYSVEEEINAGDVGKATFEKIKLSEEIEQLIFEKNRIERLERLEIDRKKLKESDDKNDDKVIGILEKIGEALND